MKARAVGWFILLLGLGWTLAMMPGRRVDAGWIILKDRNDRLARGIPDEARKALDDLAGRGAELKAIEFAPGGGWLILHGKNGRVARDIPDELSKALDDLAGRGAELKAVSFTRSGGWVVLFDRHGLLARGIPDEPFQTLVRLAGEDQELRSITFAPQGGWVILFGSNGLLARGIPDEAFQALVDFSKKGELTKSIRFADSGGWVILFGRNGLLARGIPDEAFQTLVKFAAAGSDLKSIHFVGEPALRLSLDDPESRKQVLGRMAAHKVPGLGIALIDNGQVAWARGYGLIQAGRPEPITPRTRFQAASVSKPVSALAALRLVQDGKLHLDRPLNDSLVAWKVPENDFTRRQAPTLRMVLAHGAGFSVHGFGGYTPGGPLPSTRQILDGEPPANSRAVRVEALPGGPFQYSGGGYTVLQELMEETLKVPSPRLMRDLILDPLAMKDSTFGQPPPPGLEAASGHVLGIALPGRWRVHPEMAAAGLWSTPSDLARFVISVQKSSRGDADAILSQALAREMLTRQVGDAGLGVFLTGQGPTASFGHDGSNVGFECRIIGFAEPGQGAVLMTNAQGGKTLIDELVESLRADYHWPR